jgi:hypothetical protein
MKNVDQMNDFQVYHNYRVIVRRGWAEPYLHNNCGYELIPRLSKEGSLLFKCMTCDVTIIPGLEQKKIFRDKVKEIFGD